MAKVELKQPVVAEISEAVKDAQSVVLVDYRGLTVEQDTALRKKLREAGVTYKVYKNTMMNFAFKGTDFEALAPYLEGPSAIAISATDATAPARELAKFAKTTHKKTIGIARSHFGQIVVLDTVDKFLRNDGSRHLRIVRQAEIARVRRDARYAERSAIPHDILYLRRFAIICLSIQLLVFSFFLILLIRIQQFLNFFDFFGDFIQTFAQLLQKLCIGIKRETDSKSQY